nr:precorrin-6A reductase [Lachnospiraceae bacterium]
CVATEYGTQMMPDLDGVEIHQGRLTESQMEELMESEDFVCVVDATHPYATVVSENIRAAADETLVKYLRLKRNTDSKSDLNKPGVHYFDDNESCAIALEGTRGNILLTTGSKELAVYTKRGSLKDRIIARVLPGAESIKICENLGLSGRDIIAMQGPFSKEMNLAQINDYKVTVLVTKMTGHSGGFFEKALAVDEAGISLFVIGNPDSTDGMSFEEVCSRLSSITGVKIGRDRQFEVAVIGCGMGSEGYLSNDARIAIDDAQYIFGPKRLVDIFGGEKQSFPFYKPDDVIQYLDRLSSSLADDTIKCVVLYSGDTGFYSGAGSLMPALDEWKDEQKGRGTTVYIRQIPGVSSVSALSALLGLQYENSKVISMHGMDINDETDMTVITTVRNNERTFMLLSKPADIIHYGKVLNDAGLGKVHMIMAINMGNPECRMFSMTAEETAKRSEEAMPEGLGTAYLHNSEPLKTTGFALKDTDFIRHETVPMTKEEIRYVILGKLGLFDGDVFFDVGCGTGSISIAAAGISDSIHVYALDDDDEALAATKENKEKYGRDNVTIIKATAPDKFDLLPKPDAAFIGGSNGQMREIIRGLRDKNRGIRIVASAVSLETLSEIMEIMREIPNSSIDIIQINIGKTVTVGKYHMVRALNPVFIAYMTFDQ